MAWRLLQVMAGHWRLRVVSESEAGGGSGVTTERCKTDAEPELVSWTRSRGCTLATPATLATLARLQPRGKAAGHGRVARCSHSALWWPDQHCTVGFEQGSIYNVASVEC